MTMPPGIFCISCDYDLRSLPAGVCPECGRDFNPDVPATYATSVEDPQPWWPSKIFVICSLAPALSFIAGGLLFRLASISRHSNNLIGDILGLMLAGIGVFAFMFGTIVAVVVVFAIPVLIAMWCAQLVAAKTDHRALVHAIASTVLFTSSMMLVSLLRAVLFGA